MKAWLGVPGLRDLPRDQPRKRTMAATCAATGRQRTHFRERTPSQIRIHTGPLVTSAVCMVYSQRIRLSTCYLTVSSRV